MFSPQVLLSNSIFSFFNARNHANLFPCGDIQIPGSSSFLYPLFLSSFEASCRVNISPSVSRITWRFRHSLTYRSRGGWSFCGRGWSTHTTIGSVPSFVAVMVMMIIVVMIGLVKRRVVALSNINRINRTTPRTSDKDCHQ